MEDLEKRLELLQELLTCVHDLYFSAYDAGSFEPLYTNAPHNYLTHILYSLDETNRRIQPEMVSNAYGEFGNPQKLHMCFNSLGMAWVADTLWKEGKPHTIYVIGPVFTNDYSVSKILYKLDQMNITGKLKEEFLKFIKCLPIVPMTRMHEYGLMLRCCLTGEKLGINDYHYISHEKEDKKETDPRTEIHHGTFTAEQRLLGFVREGNRAYKEDLNRLAMFGKIEGFNGEMNIRQVKNLSIAFVALCCRAAIEGGLSPEIAYMLSDHYLECIESSNYVSQISEANHSMLDDYVNRVYRLKTDSGVSPQIRACCDMIALHPEEIPDIHKLAQKYGYTDYYFSKKFKREVGVSIREYAAEQKIEKAKMLLTVGSLPISDISEALNFNSQSYFGEVFRKMTGCTPSNIG